MAGVNDWRFRLAEEEDRRRRKFGWDDLFGLLQTAAGVYTGVKGVQEAGKRTDLATQQATMGAMSEGRTGLWDILDDYVGPSPPSETTGPMGRMQFRETPPQEWPEVPGQTHVGGGQYEVNRYPEAEAWQGPEPPAEERHGYIPDFFDREKGRWEYDIDRAVPQATAESGPQLDYQITRPDGTLENVTKSVYDAWTKEGLGIREADYGGRFMQGAVSPMFGWGGSLGELMRNQEVAANAKNGLDALEVRSPEVYAMVMAASYEDLKVQVDEYAKSPDHDPLILSGLKNYLTLWELDARGQNMMRQGE